MFNADDNPYKVLPYKDKDLLESHPIQGRKILNYNLTNIKKSIIQLGNFVEANPIKVIYVDGKYLIIDGQHRTKALIELGLDIPMHVLPSNINVSSLMIALNSYQQPWQIAYYAIHFSAIGIQIYKDFLSHLDKYEVSAGILVAIYNKKTTRRQAMMQEYKDGNLAIVDHKHVEFTLLRLDSLRNLGKNPPLLDSTRRKQQFQQAMLEAFDNPDFSFEKFKKGLNKVTHQLNLIAKKSDMLKEIYVIEKKG